MQNIQSTLETITIANGYRNTVASVQRFAQPGQTMANTPVLVLLEGEDSVDQEGPLAGAFSLTSRTLMVSVVAVHCQDVDTDARSAAEVMNSVIQDVQQAMQVDFSRGGLALDTREIGIGEMAAEEGQPELVQTVGFRIPYRHRRTDPSIVG